MNNHDLQLIENLLAKGNDWRDYCGSDEYAALVKLLADWKERFIKASLNQETLRELEDAAYEVVREVVPRDACGAQKLQRLQKALWEWRPAELEDHHAN